jgi:hypothetical protein
MNFHNAITYYLDYFHSADLRPVEIAGGETWEEDSATESSLDLGSESTPDQHGSFEWLPSTTSSITSTESQDVLIDALENAQAARLTQEEAETYLKNVLKLGKNPTVENFNVTTLIGDAREDSTLVNHGLPWTLVTRHRTKLAKVKPGRPAVEGGRADRNWRIEPGLYTARFQKSFYRSASTPTTKRDKNNYKKKQLKKQSSHYKNFGTGHLKDGMPPSLIKKLNELNTQEFEITLNYWMDTLHFIGYPTTMVPFDEKIIACDESIYPDPKNKPTI